MFKLTGLLCFWCGLLLPIIAATQHIENGQVVIYRKDGAPLPNVQINAAGAIPTVSDGNGLFRLVYNKKKAGYIMGLEKVEKQGYEWANRENFEYAKLGNGVQTDIVLIMAEPGEVQRVKVTIFNVIGVVLKQQYDSLKNVLYAQYRQHIISEQEWQHKNAQLQDQFNSCQQLRDELADYAARFYSTGGDLANRLVTLLETGEAGKALQVLDTVSFLETTNRLLLAKRDIQPGMGADSLQRLLNRHVQLMTLAAKIYTIHLQPVKAEWLYKKILELQPDGLAQIKEISAYYRATGRYKEALELLARLRQLQPDMRLRARPLSLAGDIYYKMGYKDSARHFYTRYLDEIQLLAQADSNNKHYRQEVAIAEKKLGLYYQNNHTTKAAIPHYQAATWITHNMSRQVSATDTIWTEHVQNLAALGSAWATLYRFDSAVNCFDEGRRILESLYNYSYLQPYIEPQLADMYFLSGQIFYWKGEYDQSKPYLEKALALHKKQLAAYPAYEVLVEQVALTCQQLANTYSANKEASRAEALYLEANGLFKYLSVKNPINITNKYNWGIAWAEAALHYYRVKNYKDGLKMAGESYAIADELYRQNPQAPENNYLYAQALYTQALLLKKAHKRQKALANYRRAVRLLREVLRQSPGDYPALAKLGEVYMQLGLLKWGIFPHRLPALYYHKASLQFYTLCLETGYAYFCGRLNFTQSQASSAWPFRVKEKGRLRSE